MVYTAVGAKCPRCVRLPKSALVTLKPGRMVLAVMAGLGAAAVGGYLFGVAVNMIGFFSIIFAYLLGYAVGEAVSWGSGRYRSRGMAIWASVCAALAVLLPFMLLGLRGGGFSYAAINYILASGGIWKYIWIAAAAYGAWRRNA
ncbi:hypothetical protein BMS3Abin01_01217 [bacterium BMS3Abin01]|nr:hypothetical protein BMS3Abin01_01217 [bacterium BMS3Abin01]HDZ59956.1 hypothetical protein [Actinomycetota bacterium]